MFRLKNKGEKRVFKAYYAQNYLCAENASEKFFFIKDQLVSIDEEIIIQRMFDEIPGVQRETLALAVDVFQNVIADALMRGESVKTALFHATTVLKGTTDSSGQWDSDKNSIAVSFRQGKAIREAIKDTSVVVEGKRQSAYSINGVIDNVTGANDNTATAGYSITLTGKNIKVDGDDPQVGITLTNVETEEVIKLKPSMIIVNLPKKVIVQLPAKLEEGDYTLTITSQARTGKTDSTQSIHTMSTNIYVSQLDED